MCVGRSAAPEADRDGNPARHRHADRLRTDTAGLADLASDRRRHRAAGAAADHDLSRAHGADRAVRRKCRGHLEGVLARAHDSLCHRSRHRRMARRASALRRGRRADPGGDLFAAENHAYPVVLLIFGLGISGKVVFGAMHGVLPVALLTMGAIRAIPPVYLRSAQILHLSPWQTITTVLLPAALPEVFTGLRIGFTVTLLGVLLGEMFASKLGLGSMIMADMSLAQSEDMVTVAIVLFAFAAIANAVLIWIEHRLHRKV